FSSNSCPFLATHLTLAIPIIAAVLFFFVISCLLQTSFRDPGILPRATPSEAADLEKRIDSMGTSTYRPPARTMEVVINKYVVKLKYCYTCKMFRPPRTSHCSVCDNCVGESRKENGAAAPFLHLSLQDHSITVCLGLEGTSKDHLVQSPCNYPLQDNLFCVTSLTLCFTVLELVICFFSVWSILGLSGFHTYLVASNLTTNEDVRQPSLCLVSSRASSSPSPRSPCALPFLFSSLIDRRGFIQPDVGTPSSPKSEIPSFGAKPDTSM
ncbi:ZDH18 Palmitoyltransferase, partial [Columbina picui]|nr:ZDH18 Palmitoyltransferase [Columbina picui]